MSYKNVFPLYNQPKINYRNVVHRIYIYVLILISGVGKHCLHFKSKEKRTLINQD